MEDLPYGTSICFFSSQLYQGLRRTLNFKTQNNVCGMKSKTKHLALEQPYKDNLVRASWEVSSAEV